MKKHNSGCNELGIESRTEQIDFIDEYKYYENNDLFSSFKTNYYLYDIFLKRANQMRLYSITNHGYNPDDCGNVRFID